ncbi:hypothetical protein [Pantoea vagans]|uniref:hypothetical protein n=1 Tax=Pantoea vagans TaxID=470934 RepID=UPI0028E98838|nr:hypothetical protein [Pantoea vagans]
MKTRRNAIKFVEQADEAVAVRGKTDCEARFAHLLERATHVFSNQWILKRESSHLNRVKFDNPNSQIKNKNETSFGFALY